ncbi:hypothetical protein [Nocardioides aurantiacus]|uniref:Tellurite resistance protein TehB n=1 Tax=Nocardioides aurantiacus TaxID=86796 RepID=A0A3N2CXZ3_9ACTN|nr:hypothetical protein [Nocardioides aurantiacus]ROR92407.1 tellurite resistance protein TehB [Nocardioides aurantiacus]
MGQPRVDAVDDAGLRLGVPPGEDVVVDVLLDERRIWSFWVQRDTGPDPDGPADARLVAWPAPLRTFLSGHTRLTVAEHVSGRVLHDAERRFGTGEERIAVVNEAGKPLGIDKSGRMAQTFDTRSAEHVGPLLDAVEEVLRALREAGIEAFVAYGTLLGAVREQRLIGHDSDADLGYVSRHTHPVDVVRESFALQRRLTDMGYTVVRYSGAAFRIDVREADGSWRGLDLFGGYLDAGRLFLMGEVGVPFEPEWVFPLGEATLEGRSVPVPARPEKLLEAMYGPSWRVPDPAYQFSTPPWVQRALNGWFRGTRVHREAWERRYSTAEGRRPEQEPSELARAVAASLGSDGRVVDLGAGNGRDALWLARQGLEVTAYDFVVRGATEARAAAQAEGLRLDVEPLNLHEWRSVLAVGATEARRGAARGGPRALMARHLADSTTAGGRDVLWRLCSMALRSGGQLHLEHWVRGGSAEHPGHRRLSPALVRRELEARGARIVHEEKYERTTVDSDDTRTIGRVVAQWHD